MKKLIIFILFSLVVHFMQAQNMLWHYGFEQPGGYTAPNGEHNDGSNDYFARVTNADITPNYSNPDGDYFFAAQDIDADGGTCPDSILIEDIDISAAAGSSHLTFAVLLASINTNKWDYEDFLHIQYSFDGTTYQNLLWVESSSSSPSVYNQNPYIDTDFDGIGDGDQITETFTLYTAQIPYSSQTTLFLKIVISLDAGGEDIAFDSLFVVAGDLAVDNHLINAGTYDFSYQGGALSIVAEHQDSVTTANADDYILKPDNIAFSNAFSPTDDPNLVVLLPSSTITADNVLDTLVYTPLSDSIPFYAGIMPINYLNTANENLIMDGYNTTLIGVVTANDNYNQIWIQDADQPKHGILLFDPTHQYVSDVQVGDLVQVIGQRTTYNGMTEFANIIVLDSLDQNQTVNPITINPADIDIHKPQDDPNAEQWEGQLVKIENITIYDYNASYYEYYGVSDNGDSIIVDDDAYYHFGNNNIMQIGEKYNITGVITYAYGNYKINPRDTNDIEHITVSADNHLIAAATYDFSYNGGQVSIVAKHQDSLSSVNASDYILKPDNITFSTGLLMPDNHTLAILIPNSTITADISLDTLVYTPFNDSVLFYAGIMPINYLNTANENLIMDGYNTTLIGVVTANDNYNQIWIQDADQPKHGILLFDPTHQYVSDVQVGDLVQVIGQRTTYNGMTEFANIIVLDSLDQNQTVNPITINPADIDIHKPQDDPNAEQWEGQLVKVENITIYDYNDSYYEYYGVSDNGDSIIVDDDAYYHFGNNNIMQIGEKYNITGVITYAYGNYKINPRDTNDIEHILEIYDATILAPTEQIAGDTLFIDENINLNNAVAIVKFVISDNGTDGKPTIVTQALTVAGPQNTANFAQELEGGILMDENGNIVNYSGTPIIKPDSIILPIDGSTMTIADGESIEYTAYLWLKADGPVDGHILQLQINPEHGFVADASGSQFVPSLDNPIASEPFVITHHSTGIPVLSSMIYPNPATNYIKFIGTKIVAAEIITTNGQTLLNKSIKNNTLNINKLPKGTYLLRLKTSDNKTIIHKLIKE